ncbi:MAG: hypothetical protein WCI89_03455 [bacterium]
MNVSNLSAEERITSCRGFFETLVAFLSVTHGTKARVMIEEVTEQTLAVLPVPFRIQDMRMPECVNENAGNWPPDRPHEVQVQELPVKLLSLQSSVFAPAETCWWLLLEHQSDWSEIELLQSVQSIFQGKIPGRYGYVHRWFLLVVEGDCNCPNVL